jgi:beta-lactamase class A
LLPPVNARALGQSVLLALLIGLLVSGSSAPSWALASGPIAPPPTRVPPVPSPTLPGQFPERALATLSPDAAGYLRGRPGQIGVAVIDPERGSLYLDNGMQRFSLYSVAKVLIMLTVLDRALRGAREPTARELDLLESMITVSDNDAAVALWADIGGPVGVAAYVRSVGLARVRFDPEEHWGDTKASARDVAVLLAALADGSTLDRSGRARAIDLMQRVVPEQRWGIADALDRAPPNTLVGLKNGWWEDDDGWQLNSAGFVQPGDGRPVYTMAILTRQQPSLSEGLATIEGVARLIHTALLGRVP